VLQIVDEELMAVFVAGITQALHWLRLQQALLVAKTSELQLVGPDVFGEIACGDTRRSSFEHDDAESALGQLFGDPSATGAGTDNQHFMDFSARQEHEADSLAKSQTLMAGSHISADLSFFRLGSASFPARSSFLANIRNGDHLLT
jgi:hypothetical protein